MPGDDQQENRAEQLLLAQRVTLFVDTDQLADQVVPRVGTFAHEQRADVATEVGECSSPPGLDRLPGGDGLPGDNSVGPAPELCTV